ncbi:peptidylprolyl isomerase [uncultured Winogradskyella sp.]|uniref:peptidylprolyl isomerase n=1 Tax=uncultured Winogradskyella sp. TaxID=395353 RepID=UPI0026040C3E|nr:peptidylprolyl isomerase [uncultured Winogradskyella sp.]
MIKKTLTAIVVLLLLTVNFSCQVQYPNLEDGLYAEFVTNKGTMIAKLYADRTPVTVANFVALAEGNHPLASEEYKGKPYYDGTTFHRVIDGFMIQGGDPTATGMGDPGYKFDDEFHVDLKHDKPGILSMANGGPNGNGSQFFIMERPDPRLDNKHAVFGELVEGLEIQDSISNVEVIDPSARNHKPVEDVVITKLNIIRKGSDAKSFDAPKVFTEELPKIKERAAEARIEARKKAEEAKKVREEKSAVAAEATKLIFEDYNSKTKTLASGLKVHMITTTNGAKPKQGSDVKINYEGYFVDGKLFDSNVKDVEEKYGMLNPMKTQRDMYKPMPMKITPEAGMIAGFKEAAAMLKVGEKGYFYMPSHLAYGERGRNPIPPNTDLIFIMELTEISE